jgi:hypothetical protein
MNNSKDLHTDLKWYYLAIIAALLATFLTGCQKQEYPAEYIEGVNQCYEHKKGNHMSRPYSFFPPKFTFKNTRFYGLQFEVIFDERCLYRFNDVDSLDWNKILVISDDWKRADKNSLMPAWRSRDGQSIDVAWYGNENYDLVLPDENFDVVRKIQPDQVVQFNVVFDELQQTAHTWVFLDGSPVTQRIYNLGYNPNGFRIFDPWFGGNKTAPHEMGFCVFTTLNLGDLEPLENYVSVERKEVPSRIIIQSMLNITE